MAGEFSALLGSRSRRLRLLAHSRRLLLLMLPLGALSGWLMALVIKGVGLLEAHLRTGLGPSHLILLLPLVGLTLGTQLLHHGGVGEVSLAEDVRMSHEDPYRAFPLGPSLVKAGACACTVVLGGSAGLEGPGKWLGAALGLQVHRVVTSSAGTLRPLRRLVGSARSMVACGASGALAAVFRAPLSGALFAAEHDGHLGLANLLGPLVAASAGYLAFAAIMGTQPLLSLPRPYGLRWTEILYALPLGAACGLAATLFSGLQARLRRALAPVPLRWRGMLGALGLVVLMLPAHLRFQDLPITLGGGVELVHRILEAPPGLLAALAFFALKLAATALTLACGGVGGTWLPCVTMGATLGAAFDAWLLPGYGGLMAMLGATALTGAFHATLLVPVVFLAETTAQASLVVPALVATVVAYLVAREGEA